MSDYKTLVPMMYRAVKHLCALGMQQCPELNEADVFAFFLGTLPRLMLKTWGAERSFECLDQMRELLRRAAREGVN